uniref:Uncharacterized protein n=1 Tax=Tanacetum cinerariifolium TaxID=118510 RepID=A0A699GLR8_TANCI|nr:hypothetical protein [Tanacetum cinerariifolium]
MFCYKKYFEFKKKELSLDNDRLLEHIICQDVMNVVMHANDHQDIVSHASNSSLVHDNSVLDRLKDENDRLMKLLTSKDLVHTAINSLAAINDYKSMEQIFMDEYKENLKLQTELANKNDMIENVKGQKKLEVVLDLDDRHLLHPQQVFEGVVYGIFQIDFAQAKLDKSMIVSFCTIFTPVVNGVDAVVSVESIRAISKRFANTTYGFFLGKRVAYPIVANYFSSIAGLDAVFENGPCFICNNLLILKKWNPYVNLLKEYVLWGRSSYVKVLIDVRADVELKDHIMVAIPKLAGEGFYTCTVCDEYEWKPPRISNLDSKKANSIGSSFRNADSSGTSTISIVEKKDKIESLIIDGNVTLMDDEGKPLTRIDSLYNHDSGDEVASVDNDMANFLAL